MGINFEISLSKLSSWAMIWSSDYASPRAKKTPRYSPLSVKLWITSTGEMNLWRCLRPREWFVARSPNQHQNIRPQLEHSAGGDCLLVLPHRLFAFLGLSNRIWMSIATSFCVSLQMSSHLPLEKISAFELLVQTVFINKWLILTSFYFRWPFFSAGDPFFCRWPFFLQMTIPQKYYTSPQMICRVLSTTASAVGRRTSSTVHCVLAIL